MIANETKPPTPKGNFEDDEPFGILLVQYYAMYAPEPTEAHPYTDTHSFLPTMTLAYCTTGAHVDVLI